jgi:hypothetical protein
MDFSPGERESMIVGIAAIVDAIRRGFVVDDAFIDQLKFKPIQAKLHVDMADNFI